jgi:hypothetical protein
MLLVEHTRCVEHGELVHGGETRHREGASRVRTHLAGFRGASDEASDEAHEHCTLAVDRRDAVLCNVAAPVGPRVLERKRPPAFTRAWMPLGTPRFRVAPKNSPPV